MKKISDLVLYKDHHIIALNKPPGLPSQKNKTGEKNAHQLAMAYAHRDLFVIHRLDQRVSGVLVFAKTKEAAAFLSQHWNDTATVKTYVAIAPLADMPEEAEIRHFLTYDKKNNITTAYSVAIPGSDESVLQYRIFQRLENFMALAIRLVTGRKHQIRAQLSAMGIPVRGDIKYGSKRTNTTGAIDLHAYSLEFLHPSTKQPVKITAPLPEDGLWKNINPESL